MTTQEEVCEDLAGADCDLVEVELSDRVAADWSPVVVGRPVALFYIDPEGELFFHSFAGHLGIGELIEQMEGDKLASSALDAVKNSNSLILTDPEDDFTILTNLTLTDLGLESP